MTVVKNPKIAISVIVATKGDKLNLLEDCLKSLKNQSFTDFEIILVYSIFSEKLLRLVDQYSVLIFEEHGHTLGAARNLGVKQSKGNIVAFIDDDSAAPTEWLEQAFLIFQKNPDLYCLGGPHITPKAECERNPLRFVEGSFLESRFNKSYYGSSAIGKIAGCNVFYRKVVFEKIGYLDEKVRSGEDWAFHRRLAEKNLTIQFDPAVYVWHHRQGLKHAFIGSSNMVPFFMSWSTLKSARYESLFASFYVTNVIFLMLFFLLIISPFIFLILVSVVLLAHFTFTAIRTKVELKRIIYYPLVILLTLARLFGFYYGLVKFIKNWFVCKLKR